MASSLARKKPIDPWESLVLDKISQGKAQVALGPKLYDEPKKKKDSSSSRALKKSTQSQGDYLGPCLPEKLILPYWLKRENLVYAFEYSSESPSNNTVREMHFAPYKKLREAWSYRTLAMLGGKRPSEPLNQVGLLIVRFSSSELDWDNAYGGLKPILDGMVCATARNPSGLGLFRDDSPSFMPYPPFFVQASARENEGRLQLFIFTLSETPQI